MPTSSPDTEITLGTGRMLVIFLVFVFVCAVFFSIGFSLGRKTSMAAAGNVNASATSPAAIVRPSAVKQPSAPPTPQPADFSFYKAVGAKDTNTDLAPPDAQSQPAPVDQTKTSAPSKTQDLANSARNEDPSKTTPPAANQPPVATPASTPGYFVQVAAVTRQEDANSLVEALKKKQYPAFTASNSADKFYHVQVGPYADLKEAEAMRTRLVSDGYNPIVKK
ncbi:MAG: SPOR domain-containing protein [Terriglobales bacterium]|jgi:cell division septation protein DedD